MMDKAINFYELKQELADIAFTDPQLSDDLRSAVFLENEQQRLSTNIGGIAFELDFIRDERDRLTFTAYAGSLGTELQTFQTNVHAFAAVELLNARAANLSSTDYLSFNPLDPKAVQKEIRSLNLQNMKINKDTAGAFAGFLEEAKSNGQNWITYELKDGAVLADSWEAFSQKLAANEDAEIIRPFARMASASDLLPELYKIIDQQPDQLQQAANFHDLKTQLAGLGFDDPEVVKQLKDFIQDGQIGLPDIELTKTAKDGDPAYFTLFFGRDANGSFELTCIDCSMDNLTKPGCQHMQYFQPDVPASTAIELLQLDRLQPAMTRDSFMPLNQQKTQYHIHLLKSNKMNDQNLSYLQKQLLNLGFGDKVNADLEQKIRNKEKEFTLNTSQEYNKSNVDYTLHYKAGDKEEMYFFNKYDASVNDKQHTFYLNNGQGITAKEAFNLLEGRAVYKHLENLEKQPYNAWLVLDNSKLKPYTDGWNYKPERAIDKMDIVGIKDEGARDKLMKSLEKGNRHQVEAMKNGKPVQLFIEANPAEHRVNLTNYKGEAQRIEDYKKPEFKQEKKVEQKQDQTQEQSKKKSKGRKMAV